jgi:hypothetical protein
MSTTEKQPSQAGLRPLLDPPTTWRVQTYAERTGRPFSNAVRDMINTAWNAYTEQMSVEVHPGKHIPTETFDTERATACFYLSKDLLAEIKRIADAERRTYSNTVTGLLIAGLKARAAEKSAA